MKYSKVLSIIFFIIILSFALWINLSIVGTKKLPELGMFDLDGIYFDPSMINDDKKRDAIIKFLNTSTISTYSKIINQNEKPIAQFYAFCGYLNKNKDGAAKHLYNLLINQKKVVVYFDKKNEKIETELGYLILIVINELPQTLINSSISNIKISDDLILKVFQSKLTKTNQDYKREILEFISNNNPNLTKVLFRQLVEEKSIDNMNTKEKLELSFVLLSLPKEEKNQYIKKLLLEDNEQILINTISAINEDDPKDIANMLFDIIYKNISNNVIKAAIEKYGLLLRKDSLEHIKNYMKSTENSDIIKACLTQLMKYGDDSYYELLKLYLKTTYPDDLNLLALKAIVTTTYKTRPDDVLNTMSYVLKKIDKEGLALYAVKFHIENNIDKNYGVVLYRLKQKESLEMKKIALEYIKYFNLKSGISILKELSKDEDQVIQKNAKDLLLNKFKDVTEDNTEL